MSVARVHMLQIDLKEFESELLPGNSPKGLIPVMFGLPDSMPVISDVLKGFPSCGIRGL